MGISSIRAAVVLVFLIWARGGSAAHSAPETPGDVRRAIQASLADDRLEDAAALLDVYIETHPDDGAMQYNAACVRGRLGDVAAGEKHLLDAVKAGFLDFSHMRRDPHLDPLRDGNVYRALLAAADAADPLLAERRIKDWQTEDDPYRVDHDESRKLNYVTALDDEGHDALRRRVETQADRLVGWLFESPLRHTVLVAIPRPERLAGMLPSAHARGLYRHNFRELVAADDGPSLAHEIVHVYHHNHMDELGQEHPIWIQEGLACLFEAYATGDDGAFVFRANERDRIVRHYLGEGDRVPALADLATMTPGAFRSDAAITYAQARSIFRYLAIQGRLEAWYTDYTGHYRDDPTGVVALETALGLSLDELELDWRSWAETVEVDEPPARVLATHTPRSPITPEPVVKTPTAASTAPVRASRRSRISVLRTQARKLAATGRHEDAAARLRELLEEKPEDADALYDLGINCVLAGEMRAAREARDRLTSLDPSLASLLGNLVDG